MFCFQRGRSVPRIALFLFSFALAFSQPQDDLARKSQDAKELMAAGRFAEAVPLYQQLTRALPANPGLRLNLALAYHMSGQHQQAIPEFERVLKADPANFPALLSLSVSHLQLNQPSLALAPLRKAVTLDPKYVEARGMLANVLLTLHQPREAAVHFRKLIELNSDDPKAWYGLGKSYEALAQQSFDQLDKSAQGSPDWLALLADSRMERRQYRSAFYFYNQALEKKPDFPGVHTELARVYSSTGHDDWATIEKQKEPKLDCVRNKQVCDFNAGRLEQAATGLSLYWRTRAYNALALAAFRKLGDLKPSVEIHALKAEILSSHQDYLEATHELEAAQKLAPGDPQMERQLGIALYQAKSYQRSLEIFQKLIPQQPDLSFFLGDSLLKTEQPEQALPWLKSAVEGDPKLLPAQASLGLAYTKLGKDAEAIPHLTIALPYDDDGSLHYQLALALRRTGETAKSAEVLRKYEELKQRSQSEEQNLEEKAAITAPSK